MAKAVGNLKLSLDEVSQTIDLSAEAGVDLSRDPSLVRQIGQEIIDFMVERSQNGRGLGGVKLKSPYSKAYQESLEFKAFGKSATDVNMTLTGDMLGSIDIGDDSPDALKIQVEDDLQIKKSYNHNVGDTLQKRPFFGVDSSELQGILSSHKDDFDSLKQDIEQTKQSIRESNQQQQLIDIFNQMDINTEEL